jgi:hypothetical protein
MRYHFWLLLFFPTPFTPGRLSGKESRFRFPSQLSAYLRFRLLDEAGSLGSQAGGLHALSDSES